MAEPNILVQMRVPLLRAIGCQMLRPFIWIGVPGALRLYFRCLFGPGVEFDLVEEELP